MTSYVACAYIAWLVLFDIRCHWNSTSHSERLRLPCSSCTSNMQVVTAVYYKRTTQLLQLFHSLMGQSHNAMLCTEENRKHYAIQRQFNEKPSIILDCPVMLYTTCVCKFTSIQVSQLLGCSKHANVYAIVFFTSRTCGQKSFVVFQGG